MISSRQDMVGNVLVIGDSSFEQDLEPALEDAGFRVIGARNSLDGLQYLKKAQHRIVILNEDISLLDDMNLLPIVKRQTKTPVIVVGSADKQAVVDSLTAGADVHLPRTTSVRVVLAYLRALLRRHAPVAERVE